MVQKPLPNPVLHFSSATYKCENAVRRLFKAGSANIESGEHKIREGLRVCLGAQLPIHVVLEWLNAEKVKNSNVWVMQYEKILAKPDLIDKIVKKEISWNRGNDEALRPRITMRAQTVERQLIHRLAVFTVKKEKDENDIAKKYFAEVEAVRGKNYAVDC
jgi:hypothetical protein